jgi:hypothetical protein
MAGQGHGAAETAFSSARDAIWRRALFIDFTFLLRF